MNGSEELLTITKVSLALAGFAGVVSAYQYKEGKHITRGDALGIAMLVNIGLGSAMFSVLPMALFGLGLSESVSWKISSAMGTLSYCIFFYYITRNMRGVRVKKTSSKLAYALLYSLAAGAWLVNVFNAVGFYYKGVQGPFFVSLLIPLIVAGYMFARLVLRPLWRSVKEQDD